MASFLFNSFTYASLFVFNWGLKDYYPPLPYRKSDFRIELVNDYIFENSATVMAAGYSSNPDVWWYNVSADWSIEADPNFNSIGYESVSLSGTNIYPDYDNNISVWSAHDVTWPNSTIDARGAIIFFEYDGAPIAALDFGETKSSRNGAFNVRFDNGKMFVITQTGDYNG